MKKYFVICTVAVVAIFLLFLCLSKANANPCSKIEWQNETMVNIRGDDGNIKYQLDVGMKPIPAMETEDYRNGVHGKIYTAIIYKNKDYDNPISVKVAYFSTISDDYAFIRFLYKDGTIDYHEVKELKEEFDLVNYMIAYENGSIYKM